MEARMSRPRLRIGVIGTRGIPGAYSGVERVAEHIYPRLAERGHRITVYCRTAAGETGTLPPYRGVRRVGLPAVRSRALETLSHNLLSAGHALLAERFDLIVLEALAAGLMSHATRLRSVPTVVRVHGLDWQRAKWGALATRVLRAGELAAVRHAAEIIVVSRELQRYFDETYGRSVAYIPNGVAGDDAHAAPKATDVLAGFGLTPGRYLVFVGRLVPEKRVQDLIVAFRRLDPPWRLAIVGESSYTDAYVARLRALADADPRIVFTGFQRGEALEALLGHAAAFASPSELEGLPMSVLESLDRGVPTVLSDIAPHRELVADVPGYDLFHPVGDIAALHARLRQVLGDAAGHRALADRARARVRSQFSWDVIAARTEETFLALVERQHVGGATLSRTGSTTRRESGRAA
jgi:glycosyltransferase involved in cell wall biosynthesis